MDGDAKYLKRKVKAGSLDVHPTEKALGEPLTREDIDCVRHVTGTGSGLLGGIPRVVVQISALTLKGPL
jgi:hypothetical protein